MFVDPTYQSLPYQDKLSTAQEFNHAVQRKRLLSQSGGLKFFNTFGPWFNGLLISVCYWLEYSRVDTTLENGVRSYDKQKFGPSGSNFLSK